MSEANKVEFTGTIEKLQSVTTKTGTSMARWLIKVGQNRFKCACFGNLADTVLQCHDGDKITVNGSGSINSWKDAEDNWHNDFQVTAWTVEIDGQQSSYQKADTKPQPVIRSRQKSFTDQAPPPDERDPSQYDYSGGPF